MIENREFVINYNDGTCKSIPIKRAVSLDLDNSSMLGIEEIDSECRLVWTTDLIKEFKDVQSIVKSEDGKWLIKDSNDSVINTINVFKANSIKFKSKPMFMFVHDRAPGYLLLTDSSFGKQEDMSHITINREVSVG